MQKGLVCFVNHDSPFDVTAPVVKFFKSEFPILQVNNTDVVEAILEELIGTKSTRNGSRPAINDVDSMRFVISGYVSKHQPVRILIPWGSEKPDGSRVDVAEVGALKTLSNLNDRVKKHYGPGLLITIMMEDLTALHLFDDMKKAQADTILYVGAMKNLVTILGMDDFIKTRAETDLGVSFERFLEIVEPIQKAMYDYLEFTDKYGIDGYELLAPYNQLKLHGWSGPIPFEMRQYYYATYFRMYGMDMDNKHRHILSRYLSAAAARYKIGMRGDDPNWEHGYIKISFASKIPGAVTRNTLHLRTLPAKMTGVSIAPWRAKGYLEIEPDGEVKIKLSTFTDQEVIPNLHNASIILTNDTEDKQVRIQSDFRPWLSVP